MSDTDFDDKVTSIDGAPLPPRKRRVKHFLDLSRQILANGLGQPALGEELSLASLTAAMRNAYGMIHTLIEDVVALKADIAMLKRRAGTTCGARRTDVPGKCEKEVDATGLHDGPHQAGSLTWED